jgi:glycosyltransferase involved in cell wall biosynthesis
MTFQTPLVSLVIINYNYGRFLCDAIDSALNQTYAATEVIVVDDGSTDDSREIIASYGSRVIPVLKDNGGQGSAFNAGFARSSGDIICFLDADDIWLPARVEVVAARARERTEALLIHHAYQRVDAKLRPFGKILPLSLLEGDVGEKVLRSGGCWPFPPPAALAFRRSCLASLMPIPEALFRSRAESCLAYCAPLLGPITAIDEPLCLYRRHDSSDSVRLLHRTKHDSMETYRLNVEGANQVLARLGRKERFRLHNHSSYLCAKYFACEQDRPSWGAVSWTLARMSSEPSCFIRLKEVVKFWVQSLGMRQFS